MKPAIAKADTADCGIATSKSLTLLVSAATAPATSDAVLPMTVTFTAAVLLHPADGENHPHTLANSFGITYTSVGSGTSAHQLLLTSEVVEFLKDSVKPYAPVNPVTFTLA